MGRFLCFLSISLLADGLMAQSSNRLSDLEKKRKEALEQIEQASKQLDKTKSTAQNALMKLTILNDQIRARERFIGELNRELSGLDREIGEMKAEYEVLSRQLSVKKQQYARSFELMSRRNK